LERKEYRIFFVNSNPYGGIIRIRFEGIISAYKEAPLFCLFFACKGNENILQREKLFYFFAEKK